jgi:hypothetical protein
MQAVLRRMQPLRGLAALSDFLPSPKSSMASSAAATR